jgi:hypothetical protein
MRRWRLVEEYLSDSFKTTSLQIAEEVKGQVDVHGGRPADGIGGKDVVEPVLETGQLLPGLVCELGGDKAA